MKKFGLLFCTFLGFVAIATFASKSDVKTNSKESALANPQQGQVQTTYAWRMAGGQWQQGTVTYERTQQGYRPISYDFSNYTNGGRNQFMPDARFMPLNPNNELAKKNNWTHSISSLAGTLYLRLY